MAPGKDAAVMAKDQAYFSYVNRVLPGRAADFHQDDWERMLTLYDHRCAYCGERSEYIYIEHKMPIARGGAHTWENILPACASCNRRKGNQSAEEFQARGRMALPSSPRARVTHSCVRCLEEFQAAPWARYCSHTCRQLSYVDRKRDSPACRTAAYRARKSEGPTDDR